MVCLVNDFCKDSLVCLDGFVGVKLGIGIVEVCSGFGMLL